MVQLTTTYLLLPLLMYLNGQLHSMLVVANQVVDPPQYGFSFICKLFQVTSSRITIFYLFGPTVTIVYNLPLLFLNNSFIPFIYIWFYGCVIV